MGRRDHGEAAEEAWVENFISEHDREPTDDEIEAGRADAWIDYISGLADDAHDRMQDEEMGL